jgi:hypothetical protein
VTGVAWRAMTRIVACVGDLMQRTGDGYIGLVLGNQMIKRPGDIVCGVGAHKTSISCTNMPSKYMK